MKIFWVLVLATAAYGADLSDLSFMTGHWRGEINGTANEEIWSASDSGTMMGMYRELKDGQTTFYEFMVIEQRNNVPTLLLKHFDAGLKGWEEKDKAVVMPLQEFQPNEVMFVSEDVERPTKLSYRRTGKGTLEAVLERQRKGEWTKLVFRYSAAKR